MRPVTVLKVSKEDGVLEIGFNIVSSSTQMEMDFTMNLKMLK
jgi:hypothetical protein